MNSVSAIDNKSTFWKILFLLFSYMFVSSLASIYTDKDFFLSEAEYVVYVLIKACEVFVLIATLGVITNKYIFYRRFWIFIMYSYPTLAVVGFIYQLATYQLTTNDIVLLLVLGMWGVCVFFIPLAKYYDDFSKRDKKIEKQVVLEKFSKCEQQ